MPERVIDVEVQGLMETQRRMERTVEALHGPPMLEAFRDGTMVVQRDAKINAPVDTGRLRASITPEVRTSKTAREIMGVVGSNVEYAAYMELGTKPHWPPIAALETWARRHGIPAFLVARSIATSGTKARKFLQNAFKKNRKWIIARIERAVQEIIK